MLNKGPHVAEAIGFLAEVSGKMSRHQAKKTARLAPLHSWPLEALTLAAAPVPAADGAPVTIAAPIG
jgi:hypothetical protein